MGNVFVILTLATLLFSGQLRTALDARNRFFSQWSTLDALALVSGIFLLAGLLWVGFTWSKRFGGQKTALFRKVAFVFLFAQGLITAVRPPLSSPSWIKAMVIGGLWLAFLLALYLLLWKQRPVTRWIYNFCLALSPIVFILGYQVLTFPAWGESKPATALKPKADSELHPVFVFIFDGWSYRRSTDTNGFLPQFKHLNRLAGQATFYSRAESAGTDTFPSIPRVLFATDGDVTIGRDSLRLGGTPAQESRNLFKLAKEAGYETGLIGFHMPYRKMFGPELEHAYSVPISPGKTFAEKLGYLFMDFMILWKDPITVTVKNFLYAPDCGKPRGVFSRFWKDLVQDNEAQVFQKMEEAGSNSFLVFHVPIPHPPFIFGPTGNYKGPFRGLHYSQNVEDYLDHLGYLDMYVGKVLALLESKKMLDSSLLILTSDHSWRADERHRHGAEHEAEEALRHVPLLMKEPGQKQPGRVEVPFSTVDLVTKLEQVLENRSTHLHRESSGPAVARHSMDLQVEHGNRGLSDRP